MSRVSRVQGIGLGLVLAIALATGACTKKAKVESPEGVIEAYVNTAINAKDASAKTALFEFMTGKALERIQSMSDAEFMEGVVKPEFKFVHLSTRDLREEQGGGISLVYELVYENTSGDSAAKITNRKIAYMRNVDGRWKIEDTRNVKSFVEVEKGLSVTYP